MNVSRSTISHGWPTQWPKDSFKGGIAWTTAAAVVVIVVLSAIVQALTPAQTGRVPISPHMVVAGIVLQSIFEAALVSALLALLPRIARMPLSELGFRKPTLSVIATGIAGAIVMTLVTDGAGNAVDALTHGDHQQQAVEIFRALHDRTAISVFAVFAVIVAPFAEETIFRAFAFNFGLRYGGFWLGAPLSAVLFGLAHGDAYAGVPLALGGIVLCAVYYLSRNAFASMISHGLFNGISIVGLLFAPHLLSP